MSGHWPLDLVRRLWASFQARDWGTARALLHADLQAIWWATGERLHGADAFIDANARYPEGWTIQLIELALLQDGRVMSIVRVDHPPGRFFANSLWRVAGDGLIHAVEEYWGMVEAPPDWRSPERFPGITRFEPQDDPRAHTP